MRWLVLTTALVTAAGMVLHAPAAHADDLHLQMYATTGEETPSFNDTTVNPQPLDPIRLHLPPDLQQKPQAQPKLPTSTPRPQPVPVISHTAPAPVKIPSYKPTVIAPPKPVVAKPKPVETPRHVQPHMPHKGQTVTVVGPTPIPEKTGTINTPQVAMEDHVAHQQQQNTLAQPNLTAKTAPAHITKPIMLGEVAFSPDSMNIDGYYQTQLDDIAKSLKDLPHARVHVRGFAPEADGISARGAALARAVAVRNYLMAAGLAPRQVETFAALESKPQSKLKILRVEIKRVR